MRAARARRPPGYRREIAAGLVVLGAAALVVVALVGRGGQRADPEAAVELLLVLGGGLLAVIALLRAPAGRRLHGGLALALFAALAAFTAISIGWSVFPEDSWLEANRTLAYLAVFAAGMSLAVLAPARPGAVLGAVILATCVISLVSLGSKILPEALAADELFGRLRVPFDYWNAAGLMAALGVPACLWLGARREGHGAWSAVAYPATALLLTSVLLSFSRGALLALVLGLALWFASSPLRLRGAAVLVAGLAGAGLAAAWTFARPALTEDAIVLADRSAAGHQLGVLLLFVLLVLLAFGLAVNFWRAHEPLRSRARRHIGLALVALVAAAAGGGVLAVGLAPGGFGHAWHELTDPNAKLPKNDPGRLAAAGSVRAKYWEEGLRVWRDRPTFGTGAGGFATARQRYSRGNELRVSHAHGWPVQTLADLGWVGLALSLALFAAWLVAAVRAAPLRGRRAVDPVHRAAALTLLATVVVFGVHSLVDWTWFVPGTAAIAMLCAGWLAGRGPWRAPGADARSPARGRRHRWTGGVAPARVLAALGVAVLTFLGAWSILQPLRARDRADAALTSADAGNIRKARRQAREAAAIDPLATAPLFALASANVSAGDQAGARAAFTRAVRLAPASAEGWRRLGEFELDVADRPDAALRALGAALVLDPESEVLERSFVRARRAQTARSTPAPGSAAATQTAPDATSPPPTATSAPDGGSSP